MSTAPDPAPRPFSDDDLLAKAIPIDPAEFDQDAEEDGAVLEPVDGEQAGGDAARPTRKIITYEDRKAAHEQRWQRKPNSTGQGAIHVKTFVAKLRLDALEHLDQQINEWLDAHPEYEAKFVTTSVGPLVGKLTESALFVNVWV